MGNCLPLGKSAKDTTTTTTNNNNNKNATTTSSVPNDSNKPNRELAAKAAEDRLKAQENRGGSGSMSKKLSESRRNSKPIIPPISKSEPLVVSNLWMIISNIKIIINSLVGLINVILHVNKSQTKIYTFK